MKKWILPEWPAPQNIKAFTTTKNCWGAADTKVKNENSTQALKALLKLPSNPVWLYQTHSNIAIEADPSKIDQEADASFSKQENVVCTILTADCLPLLICNKQGTQVAAIHAGWRGLASGIIESTLVGMSANNSDLLVWLGPAIGPNHFEVGQDVFDAFTKHQDEAKTAFTSKSPGRWLANLYELARLRLKKQGVTQIYGGDLCTFSQADNFYSYRRDMGKTGRLASVIWIDPLNGA